MSDTKPISKAKLKLLEKQEALGSYLIIHSFQLFYSHLHCLISNGFYILC